MNELHFQVVLKVPRLQKKLLRLYPRKEALKPTDWMVAILQML